MLIIILLKIFYKLIPNKLRRLKRWAKSLSRADLFSTSIKRINLQPIFYLLAFLTFGLGDGITGAYMMNTPGPEKESSLILQTMYYLHGWDGVIWAKISGTILMLIAVYLVQQRSRQSSYWTINGFLIALVFGGLMGTWANLMTIAGEKTLDPSTIIFLFLAAVLILTEVGDILDKQDAKNQIPQIRQRQPQDIKSKYLESGNV